MQDQITYQELLMERIQGTWRRIFLMLTYFLFRLLMIILLTLLDFLAQEWLARNLLSCKKKMVVRVVHYHLIVVHLYKLGADGILRRCVMEHERSMVLAKAHEGIAGWKYAVNPTAQKVLCALLWWPTVHKDAKEYC
jgi:hypothetical protein